MISKLVSVGLCGMVVLAFSTSAYGHLTFKKQLEKKYSTMKVNCNACHVDKKPKTERNDFGKLFAKEFKDMDITATFKSKKGAEKKQYEKDVMLPAFDKALEKIKKTKKDKDTKETFDELIKAGKMPFITPKPPKKDDDKD